MASVLEDNIVSDTFSLRLSLDVLASTCIKRKKPWPRLALVGESVFLLDHQRVSVLYMETGKTKRKIPKLHGLVSEAVVISHSSNGEFIGGLLANGNLFLWHKSSDQLKHITGLPQFAAKASSSTGRQHAIPYMRIADSGFAILLFTASRELFIWEIDGVESFQNPKSKNVSGCWSSVDLKEASFITKNVCSELAIHAVFTLTNSTLGLICLCSFVYLMGEDIRVSTVLLRWFDDHDVYSYRCPTFSADWQTTSFPLSSLGSHVQPVAERGAFVVRHSRDAQLLAIAVNQLNSYCSRLVYVAVLPAVITVNDLHGMGTRFPVVHNSRSHWINDMEWTYDDLFVACITGQGSVCIAPRLGAPVLIQTRGCGIEMGPKYFLPLHPLVSVQGRVSVEDSEDPMRQQFSVAVHPSLQLVLFSDGYMVTAVELSDCGHSFTCLSLTRILAESADSRLQHGSYLRHWLQSSFFEKTTDSGSSLARRRGLATTNAMNDLKVKKKFKFEATPVDAADDVWEADELPRGRGIVSASSGKLVFGDDESMMKTADFYGSDVLPNVDEDGDFVDVSANELLLAWGLMATHSGVWTVDHEMAADGIVRGLIRVFSALLDNEESGGLEHVLSFYRRFLELASSDGLGQHLHVVSMTFVRRTIELLLRAKTLRKLSSIGTLHGVSLAIRFAEQRFAQAYSIRQSPLSIRVNALPYASISVREVDIYSFPKSFMATERMRNNEACRSSATRLVTCWKLLHKYALSYHKSMCRHGKESSGKKKKRVSNSKWQHTTNLLSIVAARLQSLNVNIGAQPKSSFISGETLYLDGDSDSAINTWLYSIQKMPDGRLDSGVISRILHSILYAQLQRYRLREALRLVELVLHLQDVRQVAALYNNADTSQFTIQQLNKWNKKQFYSNAPTSIRTRVAQRLMQSLGRVMAMYFTGRTVFVFPPHHPLLIPVLYVEQFNESRVVPLNRDLITEAVCKDHLDTIWTQKKALEYLLLSGLLPDAVWFVGRLGDWKAQLIMAVTVQFHSELSGKESFSRTKLQLPESLQPKNLARDHLVTLIEDHLNTELKDSASVNGITAFVADRLLISLMSGLDATCILLQRFLKRLLDTVRQLKCFIPDGIYLPAPPIYCLQPVVTDEERESLSVDQLAELECRRQVSLIVRNVIIILRASKCAAPVASWFASKLIWAYKRGKKLQKETFDTEADGYMQTFEQYAAIKSQFTGRESDSAISTLLTNFRDLCAIVWMLGNRNALSLALKQKASDFHKHLNRVDQSTNKQWTAMCEGALRIAVNILPFASFMQAERQLHSVVLSLILEMPRSRKVAVLLAELFPNVELVSAETQEKLRWILKEWQGVFLSDGQNSSEGSGSNESQRGQTLALVYHDTACQHQQFFEQKCRAFGDYEEEVFAHEEVLNGSNLMIGSRPFESCLEFIQLLDTFYSISFSHELNSSRQVKQLPLVDAFVHNIRQQELSSGFVHGPKLQRNISISENAVVASKLPPKPSIIHNSVYQSARPPSMKLTGLFRSRSVDCLDEPSNTMKKSLSQPEEIDVLSAEPLVYSSVVAKKSTRAKLSPRNTNNNNAGSFRRNGPLRRFVRSTSLVDFDEVSMEGSVKDLSSDYLVESVLSDASVKEMKFDGNYMTSEKMADWMNSYTSKNLGDLSKAGSPAAAVRVRVSPKMLTYALWLLDNTRYFVPRVDDLVVAVARQSTSNSQPPQTPQRDLKQNLVQTKEPTLVPVNSKKKTSKMQKRIKQEEMHNKASALTELKEEEDYGTAIWGTRRLSLEREDRVPSQSISAAANKRGNSASSECSVSVSSQLDDEEDNRQFHEALRETLARVSRPATMRLDDTNELQQVINMPKSLPITVTNQSNMQNSIQPTALSANPSGQDLVGQLQKAVRDEMRRIMEAQHQGILAVLNVLDDGTGRPTEQQQQQQQPRSCSHLGVPSDAPSVRHQHPEQSVKAHGNKLPTDDVLTDVSLSTLPSDSVVDWSNVRPEPKESSTSHHKMSRPIDAQTEPKQLHGVNGATRFLRLNAAVGDSRAKTLGNQPFSSLLEALKQMNGELGGGQRAAAAVEENPSTKLGQFRLLKFPPPSNVDEFPVKLPRMIPPPQPAPAFISPMSIVSPTTRMPQVNESPVWHAGPMQRNISDEYLLRLPHSNEGLSFVPPNIPHDDLPFPMLRLMDPNSQRVPFFVPPEHITSSSRNRVSNLRDDSSQLNSPVRESPQLLQLDIESIESKNSAVGRHKKRRPTRRDETESESAESGLSAVSFHVSSNNNGTHNSTSIVLDHEPAPSTNRTTASSKSKTAGTTHSQPQQVQLHSGYAFSPGMFDHYLSEQPEQGSDMVSNANIQYQAVMGIQSPRKPAVLKKDMSTETNEVDLINNDKQTEQGQQTTASALLPPDVFMQLRFGDVAADTSQSNMVPSGGRAYLNVADIHADILHDLRMSTAPKNKIKPQNQNQNQESNRFWTDSAARDPESESVLNTVNPDLRPSSDAVTSATLRTTAVPPRVRSSPTTSSAVHNQRSKLMMDNMNSQFAAIAAMAAHMDNDFSNTELLINAIDEIDDTVLPSVRPRSPEHGEDSHLPSSRSAASPRRHVNNHVNNHVIDHLEDEKENQYPMERAQTEVPDAGLHDNLTLHSTRDESLIHPEQWPHGFAAKLLDQAMQATEDGKRLSKNDLKELFKALSPPATLTYEAQSRIDTNRQDEQRKQAVREWMQKKNEERMREYQAKTAELRAAEKHPYKPPTSTSKPTMRDLEEAEKMRWARKRAALDLRSQDASRLVYELLSDELPPAPDLDFTVSTQKPRHTTIDRKKTNPKKPAMKTWTDRTDQASALFQEIIEDYSSFLTRVDNDDEMAESTLREKREMRANGEYTGRQTGRDHSRDHSHDRQPHRRPFTDLVKMQRPELLQKQREHVRMIRDAKAKEMRVKNEQSGTLATENRQNTYGTQSSGLARTPGSRVVKSYTERQNEMKQMRPSSTSSMKTVTLQGPRRGQAPRGSQAKNARPQSDKPRKTLTYAQQLQSLQRKQIYDTAADRTQKKPAPRQRTLNKPKTYAQQLQEYQRTRRQEQMKSRSKPYADPYSQSMDHLSTLSSWSVDDNVRRLLYDNSTSDLMNTLGSASNLDLSELPMDQHMDNYADVVDIGDLDSVVSDFSGVSWSSFVDWNEVDRLVEEND